MLLSRRRRTLERDKTLQFRRLLKVDAIVGSSDALASALQQIALVAPLNIGVLLTGASGTGKTQLARAIHDNSPRASAPFVEVNCAALPDDLVENELFGAVAGGHSTANKRLAGKVESAEKGTLFLDEIGELPDSLAGQAAAAFAIGGLLSGGSLHPQQGQRSHHCRDQPRPRYRRYRQEVSR